MLEIKNLHAKVGDKQILNGLDLTIPSGEVHAIMGPNGSGKSTLAQVLAGREDYEITEGSDIWDGEELYEMSIEDRARVGLFLAFQYPIEMSDVSNVTFKSYCVNAVRQQHDEQTVDEM